MFYFFRPSDIIVTNTNIRCCTQFYSYCLLFPIFSYFWHLPTFTLTLGRFQEAYHRSVETLNSSIHDTVGSCFNVFSLDQVCPSVRLSTMLNIALVAAFHLYKRVNPSFHPLVCLLVCLSVRLLVHML